MQEWSDSVRIAVDVIVACTLITALIVITTISNSIMRTMEAQQMAVEDVQAYRVATSYEGTTCYRQDVIGLILENQGSPEVLVRTKGGVQRALYTLSSKSTALTSVAVGNRLGVHSYKCQVVYSNSAPGGGFTDGSSIPGDVVRYVFTELE